MAQCTVQPACHRELRGSDIIASDATGHGVDLTRHGTLLSSGATPVRRAAELKALLGNANSRLQPGGLASTHPLSCSTSLEQAKPRARVEIDIALNHNVFVEGGIIKGVIKLRIRPRLAKEPAVSISDGKLRIIGFESTDGDHHEFFQHSVPWSTVATSPPTIFQGCCDSEGFWTAREGIHKLEFELYLPMNGASRPKGPFHGQSGVAIRYIALASIKVKTLDQRSIAHFYRDCIVWPRLNPSVVLAPAEKSIQAATAKRLFMGGNGEVKLSAALHRPYFIAGTQVSVNVSVQNDTKKLIKSLALTLYRSIVVFKRRSSRDPVNDLDSPQTKTTLKPVATSTLEMAQGFPRGHASTGGWWPGIPSGERSDFSHLLLLPPDALTHTRERLIEVEYTIRVSLSAGSLTSVSVTVPIRIINLLSLDPPPTFALDEPFRNRPSHIHLVSNSEAEVSPQVSQSDTRCQIGPDESDLSDFASDSNDEGFQGSDSEEGLQDEAQLGNLSMCEDAEDLVQHAIVSAQMNTRSNRVPESQGSPLADVVRLEESIEEEPEDGETSNCSQTDSTPRRPLRPRGPSSFALRVQNKLQDAATARKSVEPGLSDSVLSNQDTSPPPEQNTNPTEPSVDLPPRSAISCSSGYQVASSSFLNDRYLEPPSSGNPRPSGSRLLPTPPSIVGLPFPEETGPAVYATGSHPSSSTDSNRVEATPSPDEVKVKRPSIVPGGASASSVKAKIKELEERVRAAEGY